MQRESQDLVTSDWTVRAKGVDNVQALAGLFQTVTAQVAEEQGGGCHWS